MLLTLRTSALSIWWAVCTSSCPRCWLTGWGQFWIISSLRLKIHLLVEGRFWIQCSLRMSVWIVGWRAGYRVWFASLILKKHTTMLTGRPCFICWTGWVLGWNGMGGLRLVLLLSIFQSWLMDPLKVFLEVLVGWDKETHYPHFCFSW